MNEKGLSLQIRLDSLQPKIHVSPIQVVGLGKPFVFLPN